MVDGMDSIRTLPGGAVPAQALCWNSGEEVGVRRGQQVSGKSRNLKPEAQNPAVEG